jgi:hypothetical protein
MSETEKSEFEGKVTVTIKLPEPIYHFYGAVAEAHKRSLEEILVEELIHDINGLLDTDSQEILVGAFGLKPYIGA